MSERFVPSPLYVALMNARDAYAASAPAFRNAKDRATLRKQCALISKHMESIAQQAEPAGRVVKSVPKVSHAHTNPDPIDTNR